MNQIKKIVAVGMLVFVGLIIAAPSNANYKEAREQYNKEKKFYKESREQFLEERKKMRNLKSEENKIRYEKLAKNHLNKVIDVLIAKLDRIEAWVNNRKALSDEEKQKIIVEIGDDKSWLEDKKSKVEEASSKEELKAIAKEVREYWRTSRAKIKKVVGQILVARIKVTTNKVDEVILKIERGIDTAKNNGKDVTNAERLLDDLKAKLVLAKEDIANAKKSFDNINSIKDANKFFREGHQYLRKAHSYLKEVKQIGKKIVEDLRK